jgi:hypothetical protein
VAGLARVQQRFNAALLAIGALFRLGAGSHKAKEIQRQSGQPIARKFLRPSNPAEVRTRYKGKRYHYCMGSLETAKRFRKMTQETEARYALLSEKHGL